MRRTAYSITSSAQPRNVDGTVKLSTFEVLRLIAKSDLVVCWLSSE
jgi:hypothetical protein